MEQLTLIKMVNQVKTRSSKEFRQDDFYQIRREVSNNVIAFMYYTLQSVRVCEILPIRDGVQNRRHEFH